LIALWVCPTFAADSDLTKTIPSDAVVAYFVIPPPSDAPPGNAGSSLRFATLLADQAQSMGLLSNIDATTRGWIDSLTATSVLLGYPHAVALFDVKARALDGGGHRLAGLSAAMVIHTDGDNTKIEQRIQHLLNTYTNSEETKLTQNSVDNATVYALTDKRLPDWFVLQWGSIDGVYVISIGDGTFEHVRGTLAGRAPSISSESWFVGAYEKTSAKNALLTLYARFDRIDFSADSQLAQKVGAVRHSLSFENVDRGMWTIAFDGRAVDAKEFIRRNKQNKLRRLTQPSLYEIPTDKLIPVQATAYAIFDTSPTTILNAISEVFLAIEAPSTQEKTRQYWRHLEQESGVDIRRDIVAHLARGAVVHNHPPHLLRLPLAWTFVARVMDDADAVHENLNAVCKAWQGELRQAGTLRLRLAGDGIWFLDLGIPGPAVGMRGRWIVVSYSPFAVRENLTFLAGPTPPPSGTSGQRTPETP